MIVPLMAISNLVLTQQIYSEETNGAHAHYREPVPLNPLSWTIETGLCPGGGGGGNQQSFIRRGSAQRSNPVLFYIPYLTEKVPLSYTFYW